MSGCDKDFLDTKPNKELLVPTSLSDVQALLDNIGVMNSSISLPIIAADEYSLMDNGVAKLSNAYLSGTYFWRDDPYAGASISDWNRPYEQIFYANVVLETLPKIDVNNDNVAQHTAIKGSALFFRAHAYHLLAQFFTQPYNEATCDKLPGLPIRLSADINLRPGRGTIRELYNQISSDLNDCITLLPDLPVTKNRPSKLAAMALLSRVHLGKSEYAESLKYADLALKIKDDLYDYNTMRQGVLDAFPEVLPNGNIEVLFYSPKLSYPFLNTGIIKIDPSLLSLYKDNDLRPKIHFYQVGNGLIYNLNYDGLAIDELYLNKAESMVRLGDITSGLAFLDRLLIKRVKLGTHVPTANLSMDDAIRLIINQRRMELVGRGTRWHDLRRLNQDSRFATNIVRVYNGETTILTPNSKKYTFPIPDNEIASGGIRQN